MHFSTLCRYTKSVCPFNCNALPDCIDHLAGIVSLPQNTIFGIVEKRLSRIGRYFVTNNKMTPYKQKTPIFRPASVFVCSLFPVVPDPVPDLPDPGSCNGVCTRVCPGFDRFLDPRPGCRFCRYEISPFLPFPFLSYGYRSISVDIGRSFLLAGKGGFCFGKCVFFKVFDRFI